MPELVKDREKLCFACPASYPAGYSSCPRCQLPLVFPSIGRVWVVEGLLGRGGMGAVFAAHHMSNSRRAAVKVLVPVPGEQMADRRDRIGRFHREALALRRLVHENIVQLYDFARERDGSLYLAMERLEGPTLSSLVKKEGCLPIERAVELILPVLSAVEAAHKVGVIHRDLKPDNIVLATVGSGRERRQQIKVVDFGVARLAGDTFTRTGQALGTPVYMPPEQANGTDIDERVDVYGAGAVLYEMLTGRPPFVAPDAPNANLAVLAMVMTTEPRAPRELRREISPALESVVLRSMRRNREERFPSVGTFGAAIREAAANPAVIVWAPPPQQQQRAPTGPVELPSIAADSLPGRVHLPPPPPLRRSMQGPDGAQHGGAPYFDREGRSAGGNDRDVRSAGGVDREGRGAGGFDREGRSAGSNDRDARVFDSGQRSAAPNLDGPAYQTGRTRLLQQPKVSLAVKVLVAVLYLVLVGVIALSLLLDRVNWRPGLSLHRQKAGSAATDGSPGSDTDDEEQSGALAPSASAPQALPPPFECPPEMVEIHPGCFTMGSAEPAAFADERPPHKVCLTRPYCMDRTEVDNAAYRGCVRASRCSPPQTDFGALRRDDFVGERQPVVQVSWQDADTFCQWTGKRLPTEAEWEHAARGPQGLAYPWGNDEPTCETAAVGAWTGSCGTDPGQWEWCRVASRCVGKNPSHPVAVGSRGRDRSPYGLLDMGGNVSEWVADWYGENYYSSAPKDDPTGPQKGGRRVYRGGSWGQMGTYVRATFRNSADPRAGELGLGFRCAK